jgi:hypothetical protein
VGVAETGRPAIEHFARFFAEPFERNSRFLNMLPAAFVLAQPLSYVWQTGCHLFDP